VSDQTENQDAKPNGDQEPVATADEQILDGNRQLIEANKLAAIEWIQKNEGRGMVMGMDPTGDIKMWIVGNADTVTTEEATVDSPLFNLVFMLIAAHLPGASNTMMAMHQENSMRLQALLQNQQAMVSLLQMQNPGIRLSAQDLQGNQVPVPGTPGILKGRG